MAHHGLSGSRFPGGYSPAEKREIALALGKDKFIRFWLVADLVLTALVIYQACKLF